MLYVALVSFLAAMVLLALDFSGWSHGAGGAVNLLLLLSLVLLAIRVFWAAGLHLHRHHHQHT